MNLSVRVLTLPLILASALLAGCAGRAERIADCKLGDWTVIGQKDGVKGDPINYAERKDFCDDHADAKTPAADSAARYTAGWAQGNWDLWPTLGETDGQQGLQPSRYDVHANSDDVRKHKTPLNPAAYTAGWTIGNSAYWNGIGKREGTSGMPLTQKEVNRARAAVTQLRFDETAYANGWMAGNITFWDDAGFTDARNGTPDSEFKVRAAAAVGAGVMVREVAYRLAWSKEILNYWSRLGASDAVSGKEFALRGKEARAKGLKIFETEYRQAWEKRLADYWRQAGLDDGFGKPFALDARIANASRDGVFVIAGTRDLYTAAWREQNAKYCVPENAFEWGRVNSGMAVEVCRPELQNQLKHAYVSGQDYAAVEVNYNQAVNTASDLDSRVRETRNRLGKLEREIRANLEAKDRVVNDETNKQDRRREQDRRELSDAIQRLEAQLNDARRWVDRHGQQMQRLRREIY